MNFLPKDYDAKLPEYDIDSAEPGEIILIPLEELKLENIYIEADKEGYYFSIPAVNLVKECDAYEPGFILCYLPNEKLYATWDCDHWELYYFDNISWEDIKSDPLKYINSQWEPYDDDIIEFEPEDFNYKMKMGNPMNED